MLELGTIRPGTTLNIPFGTYDSNDPSGSVTVTGLAVTGIEVYKDGSLTQRASDAGYAVDADFDANTGLHTIQIDLADNTTANFFEAGSEYMVAVNGLTIDGGSVSFWAARFNIGYPGAVLNTVIATLGSQTSFTLEEGPAEDDALNGREVIIHDLASAVQVGHAVISDYTGASKTVTLAAATTFTIAAGDNVSVMGLAPLQPAAAGRTLGVEADGDLTKVNTLDGHTAQTGDNFARLGAPAGASVSADIATVDTNVDTLVTRITSTLFTGITSLAEWLGLIAGKQAGDATARTEVRATGAGSGTFDETADSLEAVRDRGDAAWTTGAAGSGLTPLAGGTAQGGTASTIQLAAGETFADDELNGNVVKITGGTGAGQARLVTDYTGATDTAAVTPNWATNPDATSVYEIVEGSVNVEAVSGDGAAADNLEADYDGTGYAKANSTIGTTTTNTDMRGTDNAALASVLGALADAAAAGDPTSADTVVQYLKQIVNTLEGTAGIPTFPASAVPGNAVSMAEVLRQIYDEVAGIDGGSIPTVDQIADGIWDEDIVAAHGTASTAGLLLRVLGSALSTETRDANLLDQVKKVIAVVEHQRAAHTHQPIGNIFFVDPVNGDTHANGNRGGISDPYLTIQDCHDNAVTDSNHDLIVLLSGAAAGPTTHTIAGTTTISKRYTFIRGPGRDFIITRTGAGNTIEITADGVEISGVQIGTAATGSGNGIQITDADFARIEKCWINDTQGDGINVLRGENCQIVDNVFTDTGQGGSGEGVHIVGTAGSSNRNHLVGNVFHQCAGDGVKVDSGTTNQSLIQGNVFEGCTGYGVNIGASSNDAFLTSNRYGGNTSGDVLDAGTGTIRVNDDDWADAAALSTHDGKLDTVDTVVDAIKLVTDALPDAGALTTIDANVDAIKAKTDNLPEGIQKNQAFNDFPFYMVDETDHITPETGLSVTGQRSIDGGAYAPITGTISEVSNGLYVVDLLAADTNGDSITYRFSATGADDAVISIKTVP